MIQSFADYKRFLESDRIALGRNHKYGIKDWLMDDIWTFQRLLRRVEYYHNCVKTSWGGVIRRFLYWRLHRMAVKLAFSIPINTFDEGLAIAHYGSIIVNSKARIGKNCQIYVGATIGECKERAPVIGNSCYIGPGCKIYGGICIGNNTRIGANAVVNKSFPEGNCTLVGIPAHKTN